MIFNMFFAGCLGWYILFLSTESRGHRGMVLNCLTITNVTFILEVNQVIDLQYLDLYCSVTGPSYLQLGPVLLW